MKANFQAFLHFLSDGQYWKIDLTLALVYLTVGQTSLGKVSDPRHFGLAYSANNVFTFSFWYTYKANLTLQVNCLSTVCGMGGILSNQNATYRPVAVNQWWRFFTSLFLHSGLSIGVLMLTIQLLLGRHVERLAGGLRLAAIYLLCGVGGNVVRVINGSIIKLINFYMSKFNHFYSSRDILSTCHSVSSKYSAFLYWMVLKILWACEINFHLIAIRLGHYLTQTCLSLEREEHCLAYLEWFYKDWPNPGILLTDHGWRWSNWRVQLCCS